MESDELKATIEDVRHGVHVASQNYDDWWVLVGKETRQKYTRIMNCYPQFFQTAIHAHFVATLVALYRLYETRRDTHNIPRLLKGLKTNGCLSSQASFKVGELFREAKPIWVQVSILRNEGFAHRTTRRSILGAFKEAGITPNQLRVLIELTKKLINTITRDLDRATHAFNLSATRDTVLMLEDLSRKADSSK